MTPVSSIVPNVVQSAGKLAKFGKVAGGVGVGATIMNLAFCIPDFMSVPSAFELEYDANGEKVEGTNHKAGWKEIGKCAVKCAAFSTIPAMVGGLLAGGCALVAGPALLVTLGVGMGMGMLLEKLLPNEHSVVAEACKEKGIAYEPKAPDLLSSFSATA